MRKVAGTGYFAWDIMMKQKKRHGTCMVYMHRKHPLLEDPLLGEPVPLCGREGVGLPSREAGVGIFKPTPIRLCLCAALRDPSREGTYSPFFLIQRCCTVYTELQTTTNFSFLRGGSHPHELVARAAQLGYKELAITDRNTLAGIVRAHSAAKEHQIR